MLYTNNPKIYVERPYQIVWTGAEALANITFVDGDGTITTIESYSSQTTFNWIPSKELLNHKGKLTITDGAAKDMTAEFAFVDETSDIQTTTAMSSSPTQTTSITGATTASSAIPASTTASQSPTLSPTPYPTNTSELTTGLSTAVKAGIVVAILLAIFALMGAGYYLLFFRKRKSLSSSHDGRIHDPYVLAQNKLNDSTYSMTPTSPSFTMQEMADKDVVPGKRGLVVAVNEMPVEMGAGEVRGGREKFLGGMRVQEREGRGSGEKVLFEEGKSLRRDMS
ncbi:hypothetical protein GLAREA_12192 [Glarea lozoyensis ATCC 20868]|uniref:Uncharacterized protein n=1 Tax=Glarea lozoyensis (strain ATCC 20868 / MF5171) TaxID=1116229 RepID=S3D2Q3_GLAL2|nr:uncharacterized protein GLAREA_12192 [Glarea lozoyensis ATCC 20868]EPE32110.1 hypothetical protein GLAREA_12192 [Glarea lozoyensis ATCC 20868]